MAKPALRPHWARHRGRQGKSGGIKAHRLLYHSTLGLRVIKKKKNGGKHSGFGFSVEASDTPCLCTKPRISVERLLLTLVTGPRRSLSLKLSDTRDYEPQMRARLGTTAHFCGEFMANIRQSSPGVGLGLQGKVLKTF